MPFHPACDINSDHENPTYRWVSPADNAKNADGRPSAYVAWGVSSVSISAQYAETYGTDRRRTVEWG